MSVQLLLLASLPALGWGLMPIVAKLMGGKSEEQLLGTTIAALIFGSVFGFLNQVSYAMVPFFISLLSGVFWACGQYFQFLALEKAEVSKVMPVSVGTQLLFVTLASGFFLKEWKDLTTVIFSIMALGVILTGVFLVTKTTHQKTSLSQQVLLYLCCSSAFLMLYVTVTGLFQISGAQIFLPQAVGIRYLAGFRAPAPAAPQVNAPCAPGSSERAGYPSDTDGPSSRYLPARQALRARHRTHRPDDLP